jgi:hypothetical protein
LDKNALRIVSAAIGAELGHLDTLVGEMEVARLEKSSLARRSMGSILHDFYTCCERIFRRLAIEMNGGLDETEQWHKALLYRMTLPLEGIRPAVISEELAAELDEYLAFRHVFRNIYGFELKGERIIRLSDRLAEVAASFNKEIGHFRRLLESEIRDSST